MNAYTVEKYCEVDKKWSSAYRNGKGELFSSLQGAKSYITRYSKRWSGFGGDIGIYRINTFELTCIKTEEI